MFELEFEHFLRRVCAVLVFMAFVSSVWGEDNFQTKFPRGKHITFTCITDGSGLYAGNHGTLDVYYLPEIKLPIAWSSDSRTAIGPSRPTDSS